MNHEWKGVERLRSLVMEMELPRRGVALFGVACPYCGKSDRVLKLERPSELSEAPREYENLWQRYSSGAEITVCEFCRQLLRLQPGAKHGTPLTETGSEGT
jgi:hypothetical protein